MSHARLLRDIARVIRSKNSGPFEVTFDVIFKNHDDFVAVRDSGAITPESFAKLYNLATEQLITFGFFERVLALKVTIPRPTAQGSVGETDMHAAQLHVPLQTIVIRTQS